MHRGQHKISLGRLFCAALGIVGIVIAFSPRQGRSVMTMPQAFSAQDGSTPLNVGTGRQLFLDYQLVDTQQSENVTRVVNPPREIRRVVKSDRPWEALGIQGYSTVLDEGTVYKLYYLSMDLDGSLHCCLATSHDGINWEKPDLGLVDYPPSKHNTHNNILPISAAEGTVFIDPRPTAEKRYKFVHNREWPDPDDGGVYVAWSADGLHWQIPKQRVFPFTPDSQNVAFWDDEIQKYVVYMRGWNPGRVVVRAEMEDIEALWAYDESVQPFHIWGEDKIPVPSKELPTVLARDDQDPENLHIYTNAVVKYPFAPSVYLAFPGVYFHYTGDEWQSRTVNSSDGPFECQIAVSRDGIQWERVRQPYIAPDFYEGLDLRMICTAVGMVRRGPILYQYFCGLARSHGQHHVWPEDPQNAQEWADKDLGGIYLAVQRLDGFLSMDAAYTGGVLVTKPVVFRGNRLLLNINTAASGWAKVAILDEDSQPIPTFTTDECVAINGNYIDYEVAWKSGSNVSALADKPVRLQIAMRNTKLYAFQFTETPAP